MTDAFGKLADSVIRDPRMTPAHLIILAYRTTFADQKSAFGLRVGLMGKLVSGNGLGKNRAQQVLADLIEWGYLSRHQPPVARQGSLLYSQTAIDVVTMPEGLGRRVRRSWFQGQHTLPQLAAYIFVLAGTGKGKMTYADEIQARFQWGRERTDRTMREVVERGLVEMTVPRNRDGTFKGSGFIVGTGVAPQAKPGHRQPGSRSEGNIRITPHAQNSLDALPAIQNTQRVNLENTLKESTPADARIEDAGGNYLPLLKSRGRRGRDLVEDAWFTDVLLGWVDKDTIASRVAEGVGDEHVAEIENTYSDPVLRKLVQSAARGRVSPELTSAMGLAGVRWLAAAFLSRAHDTDRACPKRAMTAVLEAIDFRIGCRKGQWLNSLQLVGKRLMHHLENYDDGTTELYARQNRDRAA